MSTANTDCTDLVRNSQGCVALAELILDIIRTPLPDRLNEPGTCEICKRPLPYAWRVWSRENPERFWEYEAGTDEAKKCDRKEFNEDKFVAYANYYCGHALERWSNVVESQPWYGDGEPYFVDRKPTRYNLGWWLRGQTKVSPVDVAFALQSKRKWEAATDIIETGNFGRQERTPAPMEMMGLG